MRCQNNKIEKYLQSHPFSGSVPEIGVYPEGHKQTLLKSLTTLQIVFSPAQGFDLQGPLMYK